MSKHYSLLKINEVAEGDEEFLRELASTFLVEISVDLKAMSEAIQNENKELAYQFAHKIKPNIQMFDVPLVRELNKIEAWTNTSKKKNSILPHLNVVQTTLNLVFDELKEDYQI